MTTTDPQTPSERKRWGAGVLTLALASLSLAALTSSPSAACCGAPGSVSPFDFNGDGYADLAVGAPSQTVSGNDGAGSVTVIYGSSTGLSQVANQLWTLDSPGIFGVAASDDAFGFHVASADFNGDDYADLAISAPTKAVSSPLAGSVSVIYGSATGLTSTGNQMWTQDSAGILGSSEFADQLGLGLAAGDLGNGGYGDLVIGIPNDAFESRGFPTLEGAGAVQVIFGSSTGLTSAGNQLVTQNTAGILDATEAGDGFGGILTVANVSGDITGDLVVGVPEEDLGALDSAGAVHVIRGSATGLTSTGNTLWTQDSPGVAGAAEAGDWFGQSVAAADFGGTTANDLAISAAGESFAAGAIDDGAVHVLMGSASELTATGNQLWSQDSPGLLEVAESKDYFGATLGVGNFGGDAHAELAIGVRERLLPSDPGEEGLVQVVFGSTAGLTSTGNQVWHQDTAGVPDSVEHNDYFGRTLQIGNFGGTVEADLAIGATGEDFSGLTDAGAVTVLNGATGGLTATGSQLWTQDSFGILGVAETSAKFGYLTN